MDPMATRLFPDLEEAIGHSFLNPQLLETALTHRSYVNEHPHKGLKSNERLEFLGDAVLDLAVSHLLMELHPEEPEGVLSKWRSSLVKEKSLAQKARALGLGSHLLLGKGEERTRGRQKNSLLADAYEAVLAAVYLDGGFAKALEVIRVQFHKEMVERPWGLAEDDFKTRLQEYTQSVLRVTPRYRLIRAEGPDHDKRFEVELDLGGDLKTVGTGKSKKEAEQHAAMKMLERLLAGEGIPSAQGS
jgi:ribonuclease III